MQSKRFYLFIFFFCHVYIFSQSGKTESQAKIEIEKSNYYLSKDLDSSFYYAEKLKEKLENKLSKELKIQILNNLGDVYKAKGMLPLALKSYLEAKSIVNQVLLKNPKSTKFQLLQSDILLKLGTLYLQLKNFDRSLAYYRESLNLLELLNNKTTSANLESKKIKIYNNTAAVFLQKNDFETALIYFKNALKSNDVIKNSTIESSLLNNIGICYLERKDHDLASHYFLQALNIRKELNDRQGQAQVLNNIGKNEVYKGNFKLAANYFTQALNLSKSIGSKESALISLQSLSSVLDTMGEYKSALTYFKAFKDLNDSIFNSENRLAIEKLESSHKLEEDKKKYELKLQKKEAQRLKASLKYYTIFGILILLLLTALFLIFTMRSKIKTAKLKAEKLQLEQENLKLERLTLEENLEFKERELTANALNLLKNNELIAKITESLRTLKASSKKENQNLIQDLISELKASQNDNVWEEFELHFTKVHAHFYDALQEKFPSLTSNEKKLCAFLRLNMSTKDISGITRQSVNSITVARSRLRKKLNIEGEDMHLVNFLMQI